MKHLIDLSKNIRYSLWLIPAIIVLAAVILALAAIDLDTRISTTALAAWPRVFGASPEGGRGILQVIASAMITVAAMTFSITVLVLSMGASQYTPRIIRTFMGNRPTQTVLGVFVGIFAYCLVVLRSIRGGQDAFNPSIAVTLGIVLALVGVGFLVYFIHHIASSIQASAIASSVAADTIRAIEAIYPDQLADQAEGKGDAEPDAHAQHRWHPVLAARTGYVQTVDLVALTSCADRHDIIVRMEKPVGAFVASGVMIASVTAAPDADLVRRINQAYTISHFRTLELDAGSGVRQLVDIALKAMSPAMNDTTTAIMCIDYLSSIMIKLALRCIVADACFSNGILKVVTKAVGFEDFLTQAFAQIREQSQGNLAIYVRLLQALESIASATSSAPRKARIAEQVRLVALYAHKRIDMVDQLRLLDQAEAQTRKALQN